MMALDSAGAKYLKLVSRLEGLFSTPPPSQTLGKNRKAGEPFQQLKLVPVIIANVSWNVCGNMKQLQVSTDGVT